MAVWLHSCLLIDCQCLFSFASKKKYDFFVLWLHVCMLRQGQALTLHELPTRFFFSLRFISLHLLLWSLLDMMIDGKLGGLHKRITCCRWRGILLLRDLLLKCNRYYSLVKSKYILVQGCWCRCWWESSHRSRRIWVILMESHHQFIHTTPHALIITFIGLKSWLALYYKVGQDFGAPC